MRVRSSRGRGRDGRGSAKAHLVEGETVVENENVAAVQCGDVHLADVHANIAAALDLEQAGLVDVVLNLQRWRRGLKGAEGLAQRRGRQDGRGAASAVHS